MLNLFKGGLKSLTEIHRDSQRCICATELPAVGGAGVFGGSSLPPIRKGVQISLADYSSVLDGHCLGNSPSSGLYPPFT